MACLRHSLILAVMAAMPCVAAAQTPAVVESLNATSASAYTWAEGPVSVVQFEGPVSFRLDDVSMKADSAVMWLTRVQGAVFEQQDVEIALLGHAVLEEGSTRRSGERLYVTARVRGALRLTADQRTNRVRSDTPEYQLAQTMREQTGSTAPAEAGKWRLPTPSAPPEQPDKGLPRPVTALAPKVEARFKTMQSVMQGDGNIAIVLEGGATVIVRQTPSQVVELYAERMVLMTRLKKFTDVDASGGKLDVGEAVEGVYLEGDVQIDYIPKGKKSAESKLEAQRAYYEIATDRAVLTDAVLHTMDPLSRTPLVMRAQTIKQLSQEPEPAEYKLEKVRLTSSSFANPSFAIAASKAYLTQVDSGDDYAGKRNIFSATDTRAEFWGTPVFWTPYSAGAADEHGFPLRALDFGSSSRFGTFAKTEWGLFELMGRPRPKDLDVSLQADYLGARGPGGGFDAKYKGGFITGDGQPWNFDGRLDGYFIDDHGKDKFGGDRSEVDPETQQRGRVAWQHQHFLPDDWQVQIRAAWVSDPTFLEEYYPEAYRGDLPMETSIYLKHQRDTEALTLLGTTQPNGFVTSSEYAQEGLEIQRMPELTYQRIGDSVADDTMTYFGSSSLSNLKMQRSSADARDLGYQEPGTTPSIPVQGSTGVSEQGMQRGDTRHEIDYPIQVSRFRVVPYVMARYTHYSDSVDGGTQNREYAGGGMRISTAFWKVDDDATSDLWDIHRVRHVIEPEVHLFASGQSVDQQDLLIYDQQVDQINDVQAVQLAMHQRWQTMRGGPGNWRSVDFFTWNTEANFFANKPASTAIAPKDSAAAPSNTDFAPSSFRGLFFESAPETSVPRNSLNTDQTWRVSESTAVLSDLQYNLDDRVIATRSMGLVVQRGDRMTYYVGDRSIHELDSNILSFLANYELSTRYTLGLGKSYDFGSGENVTSNISVMRHFDAFYMILSARYNDSTGERGFFVSLRPNYMAPGAGSGIIPTPNRQ